MRYLYFLAIVCLGASLVGCATDGALKTKPWQCDARADLAARNGQWETALSSHENVVAKNPANCLAIYHLGYVWGQLGNHAEEIEYYRQALSCGYVTDDRLFFNLGMALADMNDTDGALTAFEHAVTINPANPDNHFGVGLMARTAGRGDRAEKALLKAVALFPNHQESRLLLARIYLERHRWAGAAAQLKAVLKGDPTHPEALELWKNLPGK